MTDNPQTEVEAQAAQRQSTEGMVEVKVKLPKKWVNMIVAIQEWEDKDIDVAEYIRATVKVILRGDIESMWTGPVSDDHEDH